MKKDMKEPHMVEVTAKDVYEALKENMTEKEAKKKFSKLSDEDIDEIIGNIAPFDIHDAIYNAYCDVMDEGIDDEEKDDFDNDEEKDDFGDDEEEDDEL